jgi:hypothetical protein
MAKLTEEMLHHRGAACFISRAVSANRRLATKRQAALCAARSAVGVRHLMRLGAGETSLLFGLDA